MTFLIALVPLVAALIYAFASFDRLVRIEYEQHYQAWEKDGRPCGFFWSARECGLFGGHIARESLTWSWLFQTPPWIAKSPELVAQLRRHRCAVAVWNVGVLVMFGFVLLHI